MMLRKYYPTASFVIVGSVSVLVVLISYFNAQRFSSVLRMEGARIGAAESFSVVKKTTNTIEATRGVETARVTVMSKTTQADAEQYIHEQTTLLNSIFDAHLPPYPEFLTRASGCSEQYKPIERKTREGAYFMLYAGERFGYGVCAEDLIHYRASIGFFYCPSFQKVFKVEYFIEKQQGSDVLEQWNESFQCRN